LRRFPRRALGGGYVWKFYDDGRQMVAYDPALLPLAELVARLRDGLAAIAKGETEDE
jgi:hypothetical protein